MNQRTLAWRASALITSSIISLLLMTWLPIASMAANEKTPVNMHGAVTASVQGTPTVDPTTTALQKEQLTQQIQQLKNQNFWAWTSISTILTVLVGLGAGAFGFWRWRKDQRIDREKRDEDRFQKVVEGLGSKDGEARAGAAIMLRTFLQEDKGYEKFYQPVFDLAVTHLRLRKADPNISRHPSSLRQALIILSKESFSRDEKQDDLDAPIPLDSLSQALITVFKESFRLARERLKKQSFQFNPQLLDATRVQLDGAYLSGADLRNAYMPEAYLRGANLTDAKLDGVKLEKANLTDADLSGVTSLIEANLNEATLTGARLIGTDLSRANLRKANLSGANLIKAELPRADLSQAKLLGADLSGANLSGANLSGANPEAASSLENTRMNNVIGLDSKQRKACTDKGAVFDGSDQHSGPDTSTSRSPSDIPR